MKPRLLHIAKTLLLSSLGLLTALCGIAPTSAQAPPRTLTPSAVDDQRNSVVPVSGTRILGVFAGDPRTAYDRDAVYLCLPAAAPAGADLFVVLGSVDGILEAHYRFASKDLTGGGLVKLELKGANLNSADFGAYRKAEVATLAYLARSETDPRVWLVAQFDQSVSKRTLHLQLNADAAVSSVVTSNGTNASCAPIASAAGRPVQTLAFTAMCDFAPGDDGAARIVRHQGLVSVDDLTLKACGRP